MSRALCVVLTLLSAPAGAATIWLAPVRDTSGERDAELTRALALAIELHRQPGQRWHLGLPDPSRCAARGCRVIRISGHRAPLASYTLVRRDLPRGASTVASLAAPGGISTFDLADALAIKCSALIATTPAPAAATRVRQRRPAEDPPADQRLSAALAVEPVRALALGPAVLLGVDQPFRTFGVEAAGTFGLSGALALRATVAFHDGGRGAGGGGAFSYRALPLTLSLGGWWDQGTWSAGIFGGLAMTAVWVDFETDALPTTSEAAVGAAVEGRAALRLTERLSLGLAIKATFSPMEVEFNVEQQLTVKELFELPRLLVSTAIELTFEL